MNDKAKIGATKRAHHERLVRGISAAMRQQGLDPEQRGDLRLISLKIGGRTLLEDFFRNYNSSMQLFTVELLAVELQTTVQKLSGRRSKRKITIKD